MIHSHLYTRLAETPVFDEPLDNGHRITILGPAHWVGVIAQLGDWIRVLSVRGEGWVRADHLEARPPFQLRVHWSEGNSIFYVSSTPGE